MSELTHLSLFTGIGGMDLAAEAAGFKTVGQCEFADYPTKVLEKHWPGVPRWRDIRTLTGESFYERTGLRTVDVISGGFPCQPFSIAGKRRGASDDRYRWPEMLRVISETGPTWVFGENVAGIVSMAKSCGPFTVESRSIVRLPDEDRYEVVSSRQEEMQLVSIIQDLEAVGYEVQALIVPACAVGAPHRRDRLQLLGHRAGKPRGGGNLLVANADGGGCIYSRDEINPTEREAQSYIGTSREDVANAHCDGLEEPGLRGLSEKQGVPAANSGWWETEPNVGRVDDGVPDRVDRLRCLGNAVVPQWAYPVFRAIADIEREV